MPNFITSKRRRKQQVELRNAAARKSVEKQDPNWIIDVYYTSYNMGFLVFDIFTPVFYYTLVPYPNVISYAD